MEGGVVVVVLVIVVAVVIVVEKILESRFLYWGSWQVWVESKAESKVKLNLNLLQIENISIYNEI